MQLMVNPQALIWVNQFLPDWIPISVTGLKPPQPMIEIRKEMAQRGLIPGELMPLGENTSFLDSKSTVTDYLLPVLKRQPNCQTACERIVELRLYQAVPKQATANREPYFQLVNQVAIVGPDESFAIAPLVDAKSDNQGSTRPLPLMSIAPFEGMPANGVWLNLSGRWQRGDETVAYGRVVHYNPKRFHLSFMLDWTSPSGQEPVWQQVTGGGTPELVVDQTVGLEPQFKIYRVKPLQFLPNPIQLEAISLLDPAFQDSDYDTALLLARNGLWSNASYWLKSVRQRTHGKGGKWNADAQAQLDLVLRHAKATYAQAENAWSSPSQQVLANLIDGRWAAALKVFKASAENSRETATILKADFGRLQNRVEAAQRVNPAQWEIKAWGALLVAAQQNRSAALTWLKKQSKTTPTDVARIDALLKRLDPSFSESQPTAVSALGQIVGSAQVLTRINPTEWLQPKSAPPLKLEDQQAWYSVQVASFHDGKRWRFSSSSLGVPASSADALWKLLGLTADPLVEIIVWQPDGQQQTVSGTVRAIQVRSGTVQLLVAGDALPDGQSSSIRPLAYTESTLQWLNPDTLPIATLATQQPAWAKKALPKLSKEIEKSGLLPAGTSLTQETLEQLGVGDWQAQLVSLTGNRQPDVLLTVYPEMLAPEATPSGKSRPRTLIFSSSGELLYSEFSWDSGRTYLSIANLGDDTSPTLVVNGPGNYQLLRWSAARKQFE